MFGSKGARRLAHPLMTLALAVCLLLVLDRSASAILWQILKHSGNRVAMVYAGRASADVIVLGNSVADAMTSAPQLAKSSGRSVYTIAFHGLDAATQQVFVRDYLRLNKAPKYAIMEIRSASDRGMIASQFAMFASQSPELLRLVETQYRGVIPWRRIFTVYNFNSRILPSVFARVFIGSDQSKSYSEGKITEAKKQKFLARRPIIHVDPKGLAAFLATIRLLEQHGVKVIVVAAPLHPVTREIGDWANDYANSVRQALPPGTIYLDAIERMPADVYFEDAVHMNRVGRAAFSPILAEAINSAEGSQAPIDAGPRPTSLPLGAEGQVETTGPAAPKKD